MELQYKTTLLLSLGFYILFVYKFNLSRSMEQFAIFVQSIYDGRTYHDSTILPHLDNCIHLHNFFIGLEKKMDSHIKDLEKDSTWFGLGLENDFDDLENKIDGVNITFNKYIDLYLDKGYYTPEEKQLFIKVSTSDMKNINKTMALINVKAEIFQKKLTDYSDTFNPKKFRKWLKSTTFLNRAGIRLYQFNKTQAAIEKFNSTALFELRKLFRQLYKEEMNTDKDENLFFNCIDVLNLTFERLIKRFHKERQPWRSVMAELKLWKIPKFIRTNRQTLANFRTWVDQSLAKLKPKEDKIQKISTRIHGDMKSRLRLNAKTFESIHLTFVKIKSWPVSATQPEEEI